MCAWCLDHAFCRRASDGDVQPLPCPDGYDQAQPATRVLSSGVKTTTPFFCIPPDGRNLQAPLECDTPAPYDPYGNVEPCLDVARACVPAWIECAYPEPDPPPGCPPHLSQTGQHRVACGVTTGSPGEGWANAVPKLIQSCASAWGTDPPTGEPWRYCFLACWIDGSGCNVVETDPPGVTLRSIKATVVPEDSSVFIVVMLPDEVLTGEVHLQGALYLDLPEECIGPLPDGVEGLSDVVDLSASSGYTCALRTSGEVLCWGYNDYGQLGDGTTELRLTPVTVVGLP